MQNGAARSLSELSIESEGSLEAQHNEEDVSNNAEWHAQEKHVFILSSAGKPIYSRCVDGYRQISEANPFFLLFDLISSLCLSQPWVRRQTCHSLWCHASSSIFHW